jgi:hypothetical protein
MIDPTQQQRPAPRPAVKCAHCGSESGPHYPAHKVDHQALTIEPEPKQTCHTCFHTRPGTFMHYADFVKLQSQKSEQAAAGMEQYTSSQPDEPQARGMASFLAESGESSGQADDPGAAPAEETRGRRGRRK